MCTDSGKSSFGRARSKHKLRVVYMKYNLKEYGGIALYPPAMTLIEEPKSSVPASS